MKRQDRHKEPEGMFLSIIVSVYNVEGYIKKCVKSLLMQDYTDYEVILVDDGSTDRSGWFCDRAAGHSSRIKRIHTANGGPAAARNTGIRHALGEYLLFVDGDDYICQNSLSRIADACMRKGRPDVMFLHAQKVYPNGTQAPVDQAMDPGNIEGKPQRDVLCYLSGLKKYPGSVWAKLVSRKLVLEHGLYFKDYRIAEDLEWVSRMLFCARSFAVYRGSYYFYRWQRKGSLATEVSDRSFRDLRTVVDGWIAQAAQSAFQKKVFYRFSCYEYKILLLLYRSVSKGCKKEAGRWLFGHKWLLAYSPQLQMKIIRLFVDVCGIRMTSAALNYYVYKQRRAAGVGNAVGRRGRDWKREHGVWQKY